MECEGRSAYCKINGCSCDGAFCKTISTSPRCLQTANTRWQTQVGMSNDIHMSNIHKHNKVKNNDNWRLIRVSCRSGMQEDLHLPACHYIFFTRKNETEKKNLYFIDKLERRCFLVFTCHLVTFATKDVETRGECNIWLVKIEHLVFQTAILRKVGQNRDKFDLSPPVCQPNFVKFATYKSYQNKLTNKLWNTLEFANLT